MALCSQAISATATKRGCQSLSNIYSTPNKRICLTNGKVPAIGGIGFKDFTIHPLLKKMIPKMKNMLHLNQFK